MAFLLQRRSQSRGGTQWDSQVPGARASTAPREAALFPPPLPAGTCLPFPQPIRCLHCFLLPALSSHHTFTWSLSNCLSDPVCSGPPTGSAKCHLATECLPFLICKTGPPELLDRFCEPWQTCQVYRAEQEAGASTMSCPDHNRCSHFLSPCHT